jgi:hypothetical protein
MCDHPRCHDAILGTTAPSPTLWEYGATRRRHADCCAPYGFPSAAPSSQRTDDDQGGAPTSPPSKPLLDGYRAHHDPLPAARFSRTVVYSTILCIIPLHVTGIVRHVNRLPLAYKRRERSPCRVCGGGTEGPQHAHCLHHDIGTCLNQTLGTWRPRLHSRSACSFPLQAQRCNAIQCLEHTTAGRTTPAGTRINLVSLVA